jgi:hypothetical protein
MVYKFILHSFIQVFLFSMLFSRVTTVRNLRWIDPYGRRPTKYAAWKGRLENFKEVTTIGTVYSKERGRRQGVVNVIVNSSIYSSIESEIDTFVNDLVVAGYSVQLDTITGISHTVLRSHLSGISGLHGAIFIGELPVAWFETSGFGATEEFPHDLYFCDLNGTYIDSDGDGIYDDHIGSVSPEIWVGRLYARNLTWDNEVRLLKKYFAKNHAYRTVGSTVPERALSFVDDDWCYWTTCYLEYVYSTVVVVNNEYQTTASNYRSELSQGYEWVHLCAHSSPWGHTFLYGYSSFLGTVFNYEIFTLEPDALFYNLFACSGTRFTEENHSAGWYIFQEPHGLLALGSTKTGSMLYFEDFYGPLGIQNLSIGDAFKSWFTLWGETDWDWFYGMNILGDPTLKPKDQVRDEKEPEERENEIMANPQWENPEVVCSHPESDGFPRICTNSDGKIWVVWESGRSTTNGRSEIFSSFKSGGSWSQAMVIGPVYYWDYCPDIGIDNLDRPVAVWAGWYDSWGNYQYDIFYSVYTGSWSSRQQLHPLDPGIDLHPSLVRDRSKVLWISWESSRDVDRNIFASRFNGSSWTPPEQVTTHSADETSPEMAVDSLGQTWVFYSRRDGATSEIWAHYYTGSEWIESGPISGNQHHAYKPSAAVNGDGTLWVVWQSTDYGDPDIYINRFNGGTWGTPQLISTSAESDLFPHIAAEHGGPLWLVYQSKEGGEWNIHSSHCTDSLWSLPTPVSSTSGANINPRVTCSQSDEVWIAWQNYTSGNWDIMVTHQDGLVVTDDERNSKEKNFMVYPTTFSRQLWIKTIQPNQEIRIFDVKGSLVKILCSNQNKVGSWIPHSVPTGIYFVSLTGSNTIAKKVMLLK